MRRRDFIRHSLLAGTSLAAVQQSLYGASNGYLDNPARRFAYDSVALGPDKLPASRLAMGTGTKGSRGASNQQGIVRSRGISCHYLPALRQVHRQEFIDVDLARINPIGARMDADPATVVEELCKIKAAGKGVIGMKILGEGVLRDRVGEALQHALALDCIDCFTIGAENRVELSDLIRRIPEASTLGWNA